jgi:hypothetical protein
VRPRLLDNPLNAVDPLGLILAQLCDDEGNCYFVDTDSLCAAGFNIQIDENGNITGVTGSGVDVTLTDSNGNVVGTLSAESTFTLTTVAGAQSITVNADGTTTGAAFGLVLVGGATYIGSLCSDAGTASHLFPSLPQGSASYERMFLGRMGRRSDCGRRGRCRRCQRWRNFCGRPGELRELIRQGAQLGVPQRRSVRLSGRSRDGLGAG